VLAGGQVWSDSNGTYENVVEWLHSAPLREEILNSDDLAETGRMASEALERLSIEEDDDMGAPCAPQGRRRSRSVQSPTSGMGAESVEMLDTLEEDLEREELGGFDMYGDDSFGSGFESSSKVSKEVLATYKPVFKENISKICLWQGNPTNLIVDGIIRSASPYLCIASRGDYWDKAFFQAGTRLSISLETYTAQQKKTELEPGHTVLTPAFELPAKYIVHIVCPEKNEALEGLKRYYLNAIEKSSREGIKTIVLPFIGDDVAYTVEESADALIETLHEECLKGTLWNFTRLVVACRDAAETDAIRAKLLRLTQDKE